MAATGTETEIKLPLADPETIQQRLETLGFQIAKPRIFEANTIYDTAGRDLKQRGTLLRLRQAGDVTILTFKGPAARSKHKSREELETTLGNSDTGAAILDRLGFQPAFRYEKFRTEFARPAEAGVVTVDETPIGWFLELEGAPDWIDRTAAELGYSEVQYSTASYATLYRNYRETTTSAPEDMVFRQTP